MVEIFPVASKSVAQADRLLVCTSQSYKKHLNSILEVSPEIPRFIRIFYLAGHVERIGAGLEGIQGWMQEAGLPQPTIGLVR